MKKITLKDKETGQVVLELQDASGEAFALKVENIYPFAETAELVYHINVDTDNTKLTASFSSNKYEFSYS